MCGILAVKGAQRPFHHRLLASLKKRGPDAVGYWVDRDLQLAHTRLSIIGLDDRGTQPLENDRHVIAFNGEIYNFAEIGRRLGQYGRRLLSGTDTEVLLEAWTAWGPEVLRELTGFWAFTIYDKTKCTLTLVRDQLGIKPLYYWHTSELTCVSSLLRTVLESAPADRQLDYATLSEYARYQFTFGDKTFVKQVKKVLPGHYVEIDLRTSQLTSVCYENIFSRKPGQDLALSPDLIRETKDLMATCCRESTISDTSFTTFCSGGMDSSLITSITDPEVAYHCNYSDPDCNETFYANQVVAGKRTRLMVVNAQEDFNIIARLQDILEDFDEPTIGSVILPLDDLLAQVKRRYKVILTGTGGDELFAGYVRYQLALGDCFQDSYRALYEKMRHLDTVSARFELSHRKGNTDAYRFYDGQAEQSFHEAFATCQDGADELSAMLAFDRQYFLAGLLNIDDKMCGRHSLESRPSLLHQRLVRHIMQISPKALLHNGEMKYLMRTIGADYLPKSVLRRTDKMGFTTPIGTFVNKSAHLIREQISGSRYADLYDLTKLHFTAETKFSREVFGLLILDLWLNRYAGNPQNAAD